MIGCTSGDRPASGEAPTAPIDPGAQCNDSVPQSGCPCTTPGALAECGAVHQVVDNSVLCSMGHTTCIAGRWGSCDGERIVTKAMSDLKIANYGDAGACADPCNPNCRTTTDTPAGIPLPPGLDNDAGGGITITPSPPPVNSCTGLTISPSTAPATDITVTSTTTFATKTFTSALVPAGCNPAAPSALWYTDKFDVAQMDPLMPGKLTVVVPIAGPVTVGASLGSYSASVNAKIIVAVQEPSTVNAPPGGATFAQFPAELAADPTDTNLEIVYPYNDTVLPLGLPAPLLQWRNGAAPALAGVTVTLQYPATGAPIFSVTQLASETMLAPVPLRSAKPRYPFPQAVWQAFEQTVHRNRGTLGDTGRILVRRRVGSTTYKAKSVDVHVAPGQLKGRVYYNSYGTALVNNYNGALQTAGGAFAGGNFGAATLMIPPGATTPVVAAGFNGSSGCFVCHSASADGATLISSNAGSSQATKWTFPGTAPNAGVSTGPGTSLIFAGINPSSTRIFSSAGVPPGDSTSRLFDINGALVPTNNAPPNLKGAYPTFASDGSKVAFNFRSGNALPLANLNADGSTLSMMDFDGNKTFSNFRNLVTPGTGPSVWPAFLPAGQSGLVYQVETRTTPNGGYGFTRHDCECSTYAGATGELWWVTTGASPVAARLNKANGYDAAGTGGTLPVDPPNGHAGVGGTMGPAGAGFYEQRYNYEPSVLPQVIGGYSWVIFTSRRAYGNVATINPYASDPRFDNISIDPTPKKLWMAAVSNSPAGGTDPSAPAFYLPGQELIAGNSRAVFALDACKPASSTLTSANLCDSDLDCCGAPATAACVLDPPPLGSPPVKHCVPAVSGVCRATGQSCLVTSNCCNAVSGGVCAGGVCTDPPPYFNDQTFTRDYTNNCLPGYVVRWGLFEWQSKTPSDSKIRFSAQKSTDGVTWSPASPVLFGTAQGASILAPSWGTSGTTVSTALGDTGLGAAVNDKKIRITMSFLASGDRSQAPTLVNWRQSIECVPAE